MLEKDLFLLRNQEIENATLKDYRQYFCGNLQRPQILDFIKTDKLEIGISNYKKFTADTPHYHNTTADMIYVLSGEYHILLIEEQKIIVLNKGDFLSLPPKKPYVSKAKSNTKVLFIKYCNGNDKVSVNPSEYVKKWMTDNI